AHERAVYVEQWLPRRPPLAFQDGEHYPLRYSFVKGSALFIALDATTVGPLDDAQMAWLDRELSRGAHHPVKIVFGHVPLYPFAEGRRRGHLGDPALEHLLVRHGVSLFLSGHHHAYYPGRRGMLRLVSTACLGSGARPLIGAETPSERSLLLFEVTEEGVRELDAFTGPFLDRPVDRASLPQRVGLPGMRIHRDDLRGVLMLDPPRRLENGPGDGCALYSAPDGHRAPIGSARRPADRSHPRAHGRGGATATAGGGAGRPLRRGVGHRRRAGREHLRPRR